MQDTKLMMTKEKFINMVKDILIAFLFFGLILLRILITGYTPFSIFY